MDTQGARAQVSSFWLPARAAWMGHGAPDCPWGLGSTDCVLGLLPSQGSSRHPSAIGSSNQTHFRKLRFREV